MRDGRDVQFNYKLQYCPNEPDASACRLICGALPLNSDDCRYLMASRLRCQPSRHQPQPAVVPAMYNRVTSRRNAEPAISVRMADGRLGNSAAVLPQNQIRLGMDTMPIQPRERPRGHDGLQGRRRQGVVRMRGRNDKQ